MSSNHEAVPKRSHHHKSSHSKTAKEKERESHSRDGKPSRGEKRQKFYTEREAQENSDHNQSSDERTKIITDETRTRRKPKDRARGSDDACKTRSAYTLPVDSNSVYIGNLSIEVTPSILREMFEGCGAIKRVSVPLDSDIGLPLGYAFMEFEDPASVELAVSCSDIELLGQPVRVMPKRSDIPPPRSRRRNLFYDYRNRKHDEGMNSRSGNDRRSNRFRFRHLSHSASRSRSASRSTGRFGSRQDWRLDPRSNARMISRLDPRAESRLEARAVLRYDRCYASRLGSSSASRSRSRSRVRNGYKNDVPHMRNQR